MNNYILIKFIANSLCISCYFVGPAQTLSNWFIWNKQQISDEFQALNKGWKIFASPAHGRNSFINEGKSGEIMTLVNTAVYLVQPVVEK